MNKSELNFFASANSGRGFVNFYADIFKGLNKHYIIKGGPGTGKSSLMKAVANKAENKGMTVERFYCSSDPESLDGIIIKELALGITDGTAPHCSDPTYPGITDEIINLGDFWDKDILSSSQEYIINTVNKKSLLYKNVYSCLGAALCIDEIKQRSLLEITDRDNLLLLAQSFAETLPQRKAKTDIRLTEGITMKGESRFSPFCTEAELIYDLKDSHGIAHLFFKYLNELTYNTEKVISYEAFDTYKINMIYFPRERILFSANTENGEDIDLNDFIVNSTNIPEYTQEQITSLTAQAYNYLSEIESLHFSLEKIYISAMDFSRKEEYQQKLIKEIFS